LTGNRDDWRFDRFAVDRAGFQLLRDGAPLRIEPRALEVLLYLIGRRDRVVTKQELLDELWKGTVVTENALTRAVAQVRKVLGDDLQSPRFIQTIPTKGYRFIGDIEDRAPALPAAAPPTRAARSGWRASATIVVLVFAVLFVFDRAVRTLRGRSLRAQSTELASGPPALPGRPFRAVDRIQLHPTFSPDALHLAYAADVDGIPHIFTSPITGESETQLTHGDGETQPSWSPDGKTIAFVSIREPGIWIVAASGGTPERLTDFGTRPSWSPDGNEIAFQSSELMDYGWTAFETLPPSTIQVVHVKTKKVEGVTRAGFPAGGHGAPSWRADGRRLAFSSCDIERCAIYTIGRDGQDAAKIMADGRQLASPLFSPDGTALHFILGRYNNSALLSVPLDKEGHLAGPLRRLRESNPGVMQHLAMSLDGTRFAWTLVEESSDLYKISSRGGRAPVRLTHHPSLRATFPAFSHDGSKIAWCTVAAGADSGVWVMDADGRNPKAVAVGAGLKQHTTWAPGDSHVTYAAWHDGPALLRASLDSGRSVRISRKLPRDASAPVIAPDGGAIAFNRTIDGVVSVWTDSGRVTPDSRLARNPVWSPTGNLLAVQIRTPSGSAIEIVHPDGSGSQVVANERGESRPHSFSPDEREIAFAGRRDGVWNIFTANIATGAVRKLTDNQSATRWFRSPSWSPVRDEIVYETGVPKATIWLSQ
jgi:Tol biopolymer transport system component/DNA-binding winged helix-turn-helix (wHTH) protein